MPPVLPAALLTESKALKHCALFLVRVILLPAATEAAVVVLIVAVFPPRRLVCDVALLPRCDVDAQGARRSGRVLGRAAVANKVAFGEELDEFVLAMARDAARVADAGRVAVGWTAGETGKDELSQRAQWACAVIELLADVSDRVHMSGREGLLTYGRASRASASNRSCSAI